MKLRPSCIHHSQNLLDAFAESSSSTYFANSRNNCASEQSSVAKFSSSTPMKCGLLPKLQVFKKDGCYFALDNNCLNFYRRIEFEHESNLAEQQAKICMTLEKQQQKPAGVFLDLGKVPNFFMVDVHIVPLKRIPKPVLDMSVCSADEDDEENGVDQANGDLSSNSDDGDMREDFYEDDDDDDEPFDNLDHDRFENPVFSKCIDISELCSKCHEIFDNRTSFQGNQSTDDHFSCEKCHKILSIKGHILSPEEESCSP